MSSLESHQERNLSVQGELDDSAFKSMLSFRHQNTPKSHESSKKESDLRQDIQKKSAQQEKKLGSSHQNLWCDIHKELNHNISQRWMKKRWNDCNKLGHIT